jgi:hypothetical protein
MAYHTSNDWTWPLGALEALRKQHKWGDPTDEQYRDEPAPARPILASLERAVWDNGPAHNTRLRTHWRITSRDRGNEDSEPVEGAQLLAHCRTMAQGPGVALIRSVGEVTL